MKPGHETDPVDLFVYGTLMDNELVVQLTGHRFRKVSAILDGYRKEASVGGYARIVPDPDAHVEGEILQDVDRETLRTLDRYEDEGQLYRRTLVSVRVRGVPRPAWAYVGLPYLPKNCA